MKRIFLLAILCILFIWLFFPKKYDLVIFVDESSEPLANEWFRFFESRYPNYRIQKFFGKVDVLCQRYKFNPKTDLFITTNFDFPAFHIHKDSVKLIKPIAYDPIVLVAHPKSNLTIHEAIKLEHQWVLPTNSIGLYKHTKAFLNYKNISIDTSSAYFTSSLNQISAHIIHDVSKVGLTYLSIAKRDKLKILTTYFTFEPAHYCVLLKPDTSITLKQFLNCLDEISFRRYLREQGYE